MYSPDRTRVLVVSSEAVPDEAPGEAAAWQLSETLSGKYDLVLAIPNISKAAHERFAVVFFNQRNLSLLAHGSDVVLLEPATAGEFPFFTEKGNLFEVDLDRISQGDISSHAFRDLPGSASLEGLSMMLAWIPDEEKRGIGYYLMRLRVNLRTKGLRYSVGRGWKKLRSKISSD